MTPGSIKHLKPKSGKTSRYKQGYFNVSKSLKYKGQEPCIYRSSYEFKFMVWCELKDFVTSWSSEPFETEYLCLATGKTRNYWIDFIVTIDKPETWLIEVKPSKEVQQAERFGKIYRALDSDIEKKRFVMSNKTAAKNWSKWLSCNKFAKSQGFKFVIVTEQFLQKHSK